MTDIQELDRRAVEASRALVRSVGADDWDAPTPCADWDLRALLAHMTVQHHGFARAVAGERTEPADWLPQPAADPVAAYDVAADHVIEAFRVPARTAYLPEIRGGITIPARTAMGFHLVDYVVHGWDVAASIGATVEFDDDVLSAALAVADEVPADPATRGPGFSFGPVITDPDRGSPLDRVLRKLGRSPDWSR